VATGERKPIRPKLILNDDGSNFLYSHDDVTGDDLRTYLSRLEGTQVDMVVYCVAFGGYVTYYESEVAEPIGTGFRLVEKVKDRRWAHNRGKLRDEVGDYIGFVFRTLREMGIPAIASLRMNDAHMSSDPTGPVAGRFWMNHQEWLLGDPYNYYRSCLDYTQPAVREYLRRLVMEVVEKFPDIDGVELDGLRSPYFFPDGEGRERAPLMTELISQVRADLDKAAAERGRESYLLRVNVPRSPELALEWGMDVATWDADGLVDGISPGCYGTDYQLPIGDWKELLSDNVPVHSYINCSQQMGQYLSLEEYRGAAASAWNQGADGVYLFNFPCLDELSRLLPVPADQRPYPVEDFVAYAHHPDVRRTRQALNELGDPEALATRDKHFLYYPGSSVYRHYVQESASINRFGAAPAELVWACHEDWERAAGVRVELKTVAVTSLDEFAFALNGVEVAAEKIERLHAYGGRDARVHSIPLQPYSTYTLKVDPAALHRGENRLTVTMTNCVPELAEDVEIREMVVKVYY